MLKISKKVEYALIGLLHISQQREGNLTTARELSQTYQIPQELMGKVLQRLARNQLIESVQGVKGGYRLLTSLDQMTLATVFRAVDGPIKLVGCLENSRKEAQCHQKNRCMIRNPMEIIQRRLEVIFSGVSLRDIEHDLMDQFTA